MGCGLINYFPLSFRMDRVLAFLDSDVEAHEDFIQATVEAELARITHPH